MDQGEHERGDPEQDAEVASEKPKHTAILPIAAHHALKTRGEPGSRRDISLGRARM